MPELDVSQAEGADRGDTILVSLPAPDGAPVAAALRGRGFVVTEAPLDLLPVRALAEAPRVIVVDVDLPGAVEAVERAREVAPAEILCVGDPMRAAELGAGRADGRAFPRPVDVEALLISVLALAEPGGSPPSRGTLPPGLFRSRETSPPGPMDDSDAPPPSEYPSTSDPLEVAAILPSLDETEGGIGLQPLAMSPELCQILEAAEQRVGHLESPHPSSIPSPAQEVDLILPPELLAALDEPLDHDGDSSVSGGSTGSTGGPLASTGRETGASTGSGSGAFADPATSGGEGTRGGGTAPHPLPLGEPARLGAPLTAPGGPASLTAPFGPPPRTAEIGRAATGVEGSADRREAESFLSGGFGGSPPTVDAPRTGAQAVRQTDAFTPADPRTSRVGLIPIPIESLPDRPQPDPRGAPPPSMPPDHRGAPPPSMPPEPRTATRAAPPEQAGLAPSSMPPGDARPSEAPPAETVRPAITIGDPERVPHTPIAAGETARPPSPLAPATLEPGDPLRIPAVLGDGDAVRALSAAVAGRASGSLAMGPDATTRRVVLHEGDIVTAASGSADETLIAFLAARGDLERDVAARLGSRLPAYGRHAGAALIAHGHLGQDDLWPVLRAHAEWIIGRALVCDEGTCELEPEPPGRLKAEPSVFGGATGAEVLLEEIRRVVPPDVARRRLGGPTARLASGPRRQLLVECALRPEDEQVVRGAEGRSVGEVLAEAEPELADVIYGLVCLGVLSALAPTAPAEQEPGALDPLDEEALRQRVRARLSLVEDGDYFALLGVPRSATGYEIKRAYLELRRAFEPGRVLTAATADLAADVRLVAEVLDEAYEILREPHRRDRYRRAIEAGPP